MSTFLLLLFPQAEFAATDSDKQITRAAELAAEADKILSSVRDKAQEAKLVVTHVSDLATGLELSQQPKVDSALTEARQIKSDIAGTIFLMSWFEYISDYDDSRQVVTRFWYRLYLHCISKNRFDVYDFVPSVTVSQINFTARSYGSKWFK